MESSKHNDKLIKRKLDSVSIEPRKLKFAEVKANYEKAKDASNNKWRLYFIFAGLGIAVLLSSYLILNSGRDQKLADNTSDNSKVQQTLPSANQNSNSSLNTLTDQNSIHSVETSNEDKFVERNSSAASNPEVVKDENNSNKEAIATSMEKTSGDLKNASNSNTNSSHKDLTSIKKNSSNSSTTENSTENTKAKTSAKKTSTAEPVDHSSTKNNDLVVRSKNRENKPVSKGNVRSSNLGNTIANKKQDENTSVKKDPNENSNNKTSMTQPSANSNVVNKTGDQIKNSDPLRNDTKEENTTKNETPENYIKNTDQSSLTQQGLNAQNNNSNTNNTNSQGKNESSTHQLAKTDPVSNNNTVTNKVDSANSSSHIPEVIGSGSISARDKHQFLLSTEVIYSIIDYKVKANSNAASQFYQGEPGFTQLYANALSSNKYKLISGSASLSYVYKGGFGINAGIGFFNVESTVNTQGFGSKKSSVVIDSLVHQLDSSMNWIVIDTVYKTITSSNYAVVNGDSVRNQDYLNNLRFITIPFKFSYNIRIGGKFSIEPQAGVQLAIPVKSYQLIATRAYEFEYKKTKDNLNPKNLYFDLGLKLGYKISNSAQLYIKQGYFFRNRSVYPGNYALDYSLRSIYTTFGISIRLK